VQEAKRQMVIDLDVERHVYQYAILRDKGNLQPQPCATTLGGATDALIVASSLIDSNALANAENLDELSNSEVAQNETDQSNDSDRFSIGLTSVCKQYKQVSQLPPYQRFRIIFGPDPISVH
jgi:hypothetical protein